MNAQPNLKILETQPAPTIGCFAYEESGAICGAQALFFDAQRGCMVCEKHKPAISLAEQILGPLDGSDVGEATSAAVRAGPSRTGQTAAPASSVQVERGGPPLVKEDPDLGAGITPHLNADEHFEFLTCKQIIERHLEKFIEVGLAFNTIRNKRLYRETHDTFEDWCEDTYGTTARQVYRICRAAEMVQDWRLRASTLGAQFPYPAGEKTVRPLLSLPADEQMPAWYEAVSKHPRGRPSFRDVQAVVKERLQRLGKVSDDVEVVPTIATKPIDVSPVGAVREERLRPLVEKALASTRELVDEIRTADSSEAASVTVALDLIQKFKDHLAKLERMQAGRKI